MSKIKEYAQEIPEEIRRAIRGLDSDYRAAIFVVLYKHGELSFSDLIKKLRIDKANLYYHLKKLTESALVEHYFRRELGAEQYSYYSVTRFGQNFIEALIEFLKPEPLRARAPFFERETPTTSINFFRALSREREHLELEPALSRPDANRGFVAMPQEGGTVEQRVTTET